MATSLTTPKLSSFSCSTSLTLNTLFCPKTLPLSRSSFLSLSKTLLPLPRRRSCTFAVRAQSQNGVDPPRHYDFDLFTIGAGSGGVRASRFAASYGASVAICELPFSTISSDTTGGVGGTCVIRGCVPKKLFVYASKYSHEFEESNGFGWKYDSEPKHDWSTLVANKNAELQRLTGIYKNTLKNAGVKLIEGRGKIIDPHTVDVDGKLYSAKHILVSVGGRPFIPDIPGREHSIDSDAALDLPSKPEKIAIVGGGYIALEFAGIFNGLASEVHVFIRQKKVLRGFDEDIRDFVAEQMSLRGIEFHTEESPQAIIKSADGSFSLKTNRGTVEGFSHVFFATGRRPNTKNLGLESVSVKMDKDGAIEVDEYSRTSVPSIWAVGDVTNRINLTPVALMEGMALAKTLIQDEPTKPDYSSTCQMFEREPVSSEMEDVWAKKVQLPEFSGADPVGWISRAKKFFEEQEIHPSDKLQRAFMSMKGVTMLWFYYWSQENLDQSWEAFSMALIRIFEAQVKQVRETLMLESQEIEPVLEVSVSGGEDTHHKKLEPETKKVIDVEVGRRSRKTGNNDMRMEEEVVVDSPRPPKPPDTGPLAAALPPPDPSPLEPKVDPPTPPEPPDMGPLAAVLPPLKPSDLPLLELPASVMPLRHWTKPSSIESKSVSVTKDITF